MRAYRDGLWMIIPGSWPCDGVPERSNHSPQPPCFRLSCRSGSHFAGVSGRHDPISRYELWRFEWSRRLVRPMGGCWWCWSAGALDDHHLGRGLKQHGNEHPSILDRSANGRTPTSPSRDTIAGRPSCRGSRNAGPAGQLSRVDQRCRPAAKSGSAASCAAARSSAAPGSNEPGISSPRLTVSFSAHRARCTPSRRASRNSLRRSRSPCARGVVVGPTKSHRHGRLTVTAVR